MISRISNVCKDIKEQIELLNMRVVFMDYLVDVMDKISRDPNLDIDDYNTIAFISMDDLMEAIEHARIAKQILSDIVCNFEAVEDGQQS